jgi:hypothetical protein
MANQSEPMPCPDTDNKIIEEHEPMPCPDTDNKIIEEHEPMPCPDTDNKIIEEHEPINPIKIKYKILQGNFRWCQTSDERILRNHIRIRGNKASKASKYIFLAFERQPCMSCYTVRQDPAGYSFDIQHTVDENQTTMFFQINAYGYDTENQPYYLFGMAPQQPAPFCQFPVYKPIKASRSEPIDILAPPFVKDGQTICTVCLDDLDPLTCDTLFCGHTFHNDCLMDILDSTTNGKQCYECNYSHYFIDVACPVCHGVQNHGKSRAVLVTE